MILITTTLGDIRLELDEKNTPVTAANFLSYVRSGFYNDTIFHRVIPGFMIQCGGMTSDMASKSTEAKIKNEGSHTAMKNLRGTIAMARTADPHSATSQFFSKHKIMVIVCLVKLLMAWMSLMRLQK